MKKRSRYLLFILFCLSSVACRKTEKASDNNFNRSEMLKNYADNIIIPAYDSLYINSLILKSTATEFINNTSISNLEALRLVWIRTYSSWQSATVFNIGPAHEDGLSKSLTEEISTFPVNKSLVENRILAGSLDLKDFNRDARGLLAIEYLLFNASKAEIISMFDQNRKNYLQALINDVVQKVYKVQQSWHGAYYLEFYTNSGTDAGSSTSALYNEFIKSFENMKNFKLGLPLGKRPGQVKAEMQLTECYYSDLSLDMIRLHVQSIENVWFGKSLDGKPGIGFREYLKNVEGGNNLILQTESQWNNVKSALGAIDSHIAMTTQIQTNPVSLDNLHTELQKHTRFFKSEMSSLLGIAITYSSGDGD